LLIVVHAQPTEIGKVSAVLNHVRFEPRGGEECRHHADELHVRNIRFRRFELCGRPASDESISTRSRMRTKMFSVHHVVWRSPGRVPGRVVVGGPVVGSFVAKRWRANDMVLLRYRSHSGIDMMEVSGCRSVIQDRLQLTTERSVGGAHLLYRIVSSLHLYCLHCSDMGIA
jgi:hypothetical protein